VDHSTLEAIRSEFHVTQAMIFEGANKVRIFLENGSPPEGFQTVAPTLEDAYFVCMKSDLSSIITMPETGESK
ncbi:MAG: hypothetical protein RJA81_1743, partial [Planctomycetota bacterium]